MSRRRDPFKDIEEFFDRLNENVGEFGRGLETGIGAPNMLVDVAESDGEVVVSADLPGFEKAEIDVSVKGRQLRIAADHTTEEETGDGEGDATYYRRERTRRSLSRTVPLPTDVDETGANAHYENGVLVVTLPKQDAGDDGTDIRVN
jgi:HSP20 family protein